MWSSIGAAVAIVQSFLGLTSPAPVSSQYHGPIAHGGAWRDAFLRADEMISNMTLEERVNLTTAVFGPCPSNSGGVSRLGIPGMCFDDGRECARAPARVENDGSCGSKIHRLCYAVAFCVYCGRLVRQGPHIAAGQAYRAGVQGEGYQRRARSCECYSHMEESDFRSLVARWADRKCRGVSRPR